MKLWILGIEFFKISLFTIGGGLAMIPIIENTFVKKRHLLKESDIVDMVGITQTIPGLIAINSAVFVGHKLAGWRGSLMATLGVILPSMIIITLVAIFFPLQKLSHPQLLSAFSCVRACVLGMFLVLFGRIVRVLIRSRLDILFFLFLAILLFLGLNPVLIVFISCLAGWGYESYIHPKLKAKK